MKKANLFSAEREFIEKINKTGGRPLQELTPEEAREFLHNVQAAIPVDVPDIEFRDIKAELAGGRTMTLRVFNPLGGVEPLGTIYYIHGGGWVMGDAFTHRRLVSVLAKGVPASVIFPLYTPAPEGQFPQITDDLFHALSDIVANGHKYGLNVSRLAVAGDSVGGNMAAVMALMAKENGFVPKIDFQLLFYPVTGADFNTESYEQFASGPWLTKKAMEWFWQQYLPDLEKRKSKEASPLAATKHDLQGLPPALVVTAENDVLRDEGEAYARKLDDAGVLTFAVRVNGTIHDFLMLNDLGGSPSVQAATALSLEMLRNGFSRG